MIVHTLVWGTYWVAIWLASLYVITLLMKGRMVRARRDPKLRIWLLDKEDPVEIQTNRLDWVAVTTDVNNPRPLDMMCQVAHRALIRTGFDVPQSYFLFLEKCLDGNPEEITPGDPEMMDPTQKDPLEQQQ